MSTVKHPTSIAGAKIFTVGDASVQTSDKTKAMPGGNVK